MHLDMSEDEAKLLKTELSRRIAELDDELVHTDKHELQVALDKDIERLRVIEKRLARVLAAGSHSSP